MRHREWLETDNQPLMTIKNSETDENYSEEESSGSVCLDVFDQPIKMETDIEESFAGIPFNSRCWLITLSKNPTTLMKGELLQLFQGKPAYAFFEDKIYFIDNGYIKILEMEKYEESRTIFPENINQPQCASIEQLVKLTSITHHSLHSWHKEALEIIKELKTQVEPRIEKTRHDYTQSTYLIGYNMVTSAVTPFASFGFLWGVDSWFSYPATHTPLLISLYNQLQTLQDTLQPVQNIYQSYSDVVSQWIYNCASVGKLPENICKYGHYLKSVICQSNFDTMCENLQLKEQIQPTLNALTEQVQALEQNISDNNGNYHFIAEPPFSYIMIPVSVATLFWLGYLAKEYHRESAKHDKELFDIDCAYMCLEPIKEQHFSNVFWFYNTLPNWSLSTKQETNLRAIKKLEHYVNQMDGFFSFFKACKRAALPKEVTMKIMDDLQENATESTCLSPALKGTK